MNTRVYLGSEPKRTKAGQLSNERKASIPLK